MLTYTNKTFIFCFKFSVNHGLGTQVNARWADKDAKYLISAYTWFLVMIGPDLIGRVQQALLGSTIRKKENSIAGLQKLKLGSIMGVSKESTILHTAKSYRTGYQEYSRLWCLILQQAQEVCSSFATILAFLPVDAENQHPMTSTPKEVQALIKLCESVMNSYDGVKRQRLLAGSSNPHSPEQDGLGWVVSSLRSTRILKS